MEIIRNPEAWQKRFVSEIAYHKFREWLPQRKFILERKFIERDLLPHNPNVKRQFKERPGWEYFTSKVWDANEHLVKEFYANAAHIKKGTKVTKVRNLTMKFDGKTINNYLGFPEEDESLYLEKVALDEAARLWLAEYPELPGTTPAWLTSRVQILRKTLNLEVKGWVTFVCSGLDPTTHENSLPVSGAILGASIMAGYLINIENVMSRVIRRVVNEGDRSYPFPNFLTVYFEGRDVEKRKFDVKVKPKMPFSW